MTSGRARPLAVVALACLLVLAGCSSGTGTPTGPTSETPGSPVETGTATGATSEPTQSGTAEPTATSGPSVTDCTGMQTTPTGTPDVSSVTIPVRGNGTLEFDVNETYARTMYLLGNPEHTPPEEVYAYETNVSFTPAVEDPFVRTLVDGPASAPSARVPGVEGIPISISPGEPAFKHEFVMAHESVHGPQLNLLDGTPAMEYAFSRTHHEQRLGGAVLEGGASFVATEYMLRYTDVSRERVLNATDQYRTAGSAGKYHWAPYHFGQRYVETRYDTPVEHWCVYHDPPRTGEELIHVLEPGSEPPRALDVNVDAADWTTVRQERRGELDVRAVLAAELPEDRAADGAAGWGNDELVELERDGERGFVWTVRWDDAADAAEFREAFAAAMDARPSTTAEGDGRWTADGTTVRLEQVAPETVVVVTGSNPFTTAVGVEGGNESVTVSVADDRDRSGRR